MNIATTVSEIAVLLADMAISAQDFGRTMPAELLPVQEYSFDVLPFQKVVINVLPPKESIGELHLRTVAFGKRFWPMAVEIVRTWRTIGPAVQAAADKLESLNKPEADDVQWIFDRLENAVGDLHRVLRVLREIYSAEQWPSDDVIRRWFHGVCFADPVMGHDRYAPAVAAIKWLERQQASAKRGDTAGSNIPRGKSERRKVLQTAVAEEVKKGKSIKTSIKHISEQWFISERTLWADWKSVKGRRQ